MRDSRAWRRRLPLLAALVLVALLSGCWGEPQTTVNPKSDFTESIQGVYVIIFWLAMAVFVGVLALTLIIAIRYRERPGREAVQIHGNTRLEVIWTMIPVVIVAAMIIPSWQVIHETTSDRPEDAMVVQAVAKQWWFEFHYPELGITTANELHLEVDKPVYIELHADDVIHSFWIPQLAGKVDMVPGHINDMWFTPFEAREEAYLGQCAEFCGTSHANMRFRVFVDTAADFQAWVENEQSDAAEPTSDLGRQGQEIFARSACIGCHTVKGVSELSAPVGPDLTHVGSRETIGSGTIENTVDNLFDWISNPDDLKPGIIPEDDPRFMPAFENLLTDDEIRAIATYLSELQ